MSRREDVEELRIDTGRLRMFALAAGPAKGPLVLLLHGFPELSRSWRHQLPALAAAGYRCVAPDQRGYGETEIGGPYDVRALAADVVALVRALGRDRATVVGHDWGGGVAWAAARLHPNTIERLVVLNCPPPWVLARALTRNMRQLRRSRYLIFFQLPLLPEWSLARNDAAQVARALVGGSHVRGTFPPEELAVYRASFSRPGRAKAAVDWYRAAFRHPPRFGRQAREARIAAPTLIIWGVHDRFLGRELVDRQQLASSFAAGHVPEIVFVQGAGHFVQNEAPERVNEELVRWLGPA